ncbi:MAG: TIGR04282 family arsenosugar biosynthesis glycosyltransferase [Acidobacteriota bacterium]|nr:TIGR04282 family arsenosugar biosynthesis glycosyltransferase [Acidobacteriota bacterium]
MTGQPQVIVMAKAPRPGRVKTRLHPLLGPTGSARLAAGLLAHTVSVATASGFEVTVAYDPPDAADDISAFVPSGAGMVPQPPGDLGERMGAAATGPLSSGRPVILIGTDAPTLRVDTLCDAAERLERTDVVLGPAADGGYYLLGLSRPVPAIFALGAVWGGPTVLLDSLDAAAKEGATVSLLEIRRDLDTPDDAAALAADPDLPPELRQLLGVTA